MGQTQIEMAFPALDKNGQQRGGKRPGAGRKPTRWVGGRRLGKHVRRPEIDGRNCAVHVTMRVAESVGCLRQRKIWDGVRAVMRRAGGQ